MQITNFNQLIEKARMSNARKLVIALADDEYVLKAVKEAVTYKIVIPIFIGNKLKINNICKKIEFNITGFEIIDISDQAVASEMAVKLIYSNQADILMKGFVPTATLIRNVLKQEHSLLKSKIISHLTLAQLPSYHKFIAVSDVAINIKPDVNEKAIIIENAVNALLKIGYINPKVALICPVEKENLKIESTIHAIELKKMFLEGHIKNCIVDGPLALDNALSKEAAFHKNIDSEVAGDADLLIVPNLDAGNILYKSIVYLAGGIIAAIVVGAKVPIVLTSRSDSELSKLYSIALAVCLLDKD
jgi:phosphate butyryltransferase